MSEITVEAAAYNLQLEEKTNELVGKAILKLFEDPAFVKQLLANYIFMNRLTTQLEMDYDFKRFIHQTIANKLQGN